MQIKKKTLYLIAIPCLVILGALGDRLLIRDKTEINLVGTVDNKKIYVDDIDQLLRSRTQNAEVNFLALSPQKKRQIFDDIAKDYVWVIAAENAKLDQEIDFQKQVELYRNMLLKEAYFKHLDTVEISDNEVKAIYESKKTELENLQQHHFKQMVFTTEKQADAAIDALKKNTFEAVAKARSIDKKSAAKGGDMGLTIETMINPEVAAILKKLKVGRISKPMQIGQKWFVLKHVSQKKAAALPYEKALEKIAQTLRQKKIKAQLQAAQKDAEVEYLWENGPFSSIAGEG